MKEWFKSKKFWCSLLAAGVMAAHEKMGISFDSAQTAAYALMSGAGIEGLVDVFAVILNRSKSNG